MTDGPNSNPQPPRPEGNGPGQPPQQPPQQPQQPPGQPYGASGPQQPNQQPNQQGQQYPGQQQPYGAPGPQQPNQQGQPYQQQYPGGPYGGPREKKKLGGGAKAGIIGGGVAVVLIIALIAGWLIVGHLNKTQHGPDHVVADYVNALKNGDAKAMKQLAAPNVADDADDSLLSGKAFTKASKAVKDIETSDPQINGDNAEERITYSVDGHPHSTTLKLHKDGKEGVFFDKWKLESPTVNSITVNGTDIDKVDINGQTVKLKDDEAKLAVYPGAYTVSVPDSKYFDGSSDDVSVGYSSSTVSIPTSVSLTRETNDALDNEVKRLVKEKVEKCAETKDPRTSGCPFYSTNTDIKKGTVKWNVGSVPDVSVSGTSDGQISFYSTTSLKVDFKAKSKTHSSGYWHLRTPASVYLSGSGTVKGDKVSIEFTSAA